jgi:hypothetical protein
VDRAHAAGTVGTAAGSLTLGAWAFSPSGAEALDELPLDRAGRRVLAPGHAEIGLHPVRQPDFVLVDEHDAIRPPGTEGLVVEQ